MNIIKHRKTDTKPEEQVSVNDEVIISSGIDTMDIMPTELPEEITNGT